MDVDELGVKTAADCWACRRGLLVDPGSEQPLLAEVVIEGALLTEARQILSETGQLR